jgi:hypothetical protein
MWLRPLGLRVFLCDGMVAAVMENLIPEGVSYR